jgi:hypothetical protein
MSQYFLNKPHSDKQSACALGLLQNVNALLREAEDNSAFIEQIDPDTGTGISGARGGTGDGGFRLSTATTGAPNSAHKEARAVDVYDPHNILDDWITDEILERFKLYREHPNSTPGWCHLTTRPPASGNRTFVP